MTRRNEIEGDPLLLAAYLEGNLGEAETARAEAWLAEDPDALDALLAARAALEARPEPVPAAVVARAQDIVRGGGAAAGPRGGVFALLRPLAFGGGLAAACLAVAVAGFQLGEVTYQAASDMGQLTSSALLPDLAEGPFGEAPNEG